jgi:hypothetical protein
MPEFKPHGPYLYTDGNAYGVVPNGNTGWGTLYTAHRNVDDTIDHDNWSEFEPQNEAEHRFNTGMIVTLMAWRDATKPF